MDFNLTDEHEMLSKSAASFVKKEHSFERLRELKDDKWGYTKEMWDKMAELGWMGFIYPEDYGGFGLDFIFVMVLMQELGKGLLPEPYISNILLGGNLVNLVGNTSQKQAILPKIVEGSLFITAAYLEDDGRYDLNYCATSATKNNEGYILSGKKIFVQDGLSADKIIISARTSGSVADKEGITLFMVSSDCKGLEKTPLRTMDGKTSCMINLKEMFVSEADIVGELGGGFSALSEAIDMATAALCAEMVGGMQSALDLTVSYISEREQFGKPIGSFQAVQHKAADMLIQKELATSALYYAIASIDEKTEDRSEAVSIAKAKCSSAYIDITKTAIQLHGAIGFTNEADIGFFFKKAKVSEILYGDTDYHLDRYATLRGY